MKAAEKTEYYAVIFSSQVSFFEKSVDKKSYELMAERMLELAKLQEGYLGVETCRDQNGFGITVSYWESKESIRAWRVNTEHQLAQELGRVKWYSSFTTRVCKVEREYGFNASEVK